jgi:hypothetical protein
MTNNGRAISTAVIRPAGSPGGSLRLVGVQFLWTAVDR